MKKIQAILLILIASLTASLLTACNTTPNSDTQNVETEVSTVGIVNIAAILDPVVDGLKVGMSEFEYVEGTNINYIYNGPVSRDDLNKEIQSLIDQDVDIIVSLTTPATIAAKEMTQENQVPVVFVPVNDPVGTGIVSDLTNPGGNITGIISGASETRRLEWLLTIAPDSKRIYYPYNPDDPSPVGTLETLSTDVAPQLGVELVPFEVSTVELLQDAIHNIPDDVDAIYLPSDSRVGSALSDWVAVAEERKLPMSASSQAHVDAGVLCSYSYSPYEAGRQAARLVDQILHGVDAGTLPVETAEPLFSINLVAANAIELEIPDDVLGQANIIVREDQQ